MKKIFVWLRKHWIAVLIGLALAIGGYFFLKDDESNATPAARMQVEPVEKGDISIAVSGSGQIEADSQVDLKPVAAGDAIEVTSVLVKNDQEVTKGQVIAVLDNENARRDIERAELNFRQAKIRYKQTEDLNPKKTVDDKRERQLAEVSISESRIALAEAQDRLDDYTIKAPFDGIVTGLTVDSGDTVSQTGILASVITKNMKVVITLNEVDAAKVRVGNTVALTFDALPNNGTTGKITKLDTIGVAEQGVISYGAEITLDEQNPNLKPGMSVAADISVEKKEGVLLVPNAAITYEDDKAYVRIALAGQSAEAPVMPQGNNERGQMQRGERKEITIGITDNVNTEVLSGLREGDRVLVVTNGGAGLSAQAGNQGGFNLFPGRTGAGGGRGNFNR